MVTVALVGSAVIGAAATDISSSDAANAQKEASEQATKTEQNMYNQNAATLNPFITGGEGAYSTLNNLLGAGGSGNATQMQDTLNNLPGYQFTLNQGLKSTQNAAAARGLGSSGAALKGAANYSTGLANSDYGTYVNQLQNSANTGESAAGALAGVGTTVAGEIGQNQIGIGNANAAADTAIGNSISSGVNNISQYYMLNNLLNSTNSASGTGATGSLFSQDTF